MSHPTMGAWIEITLPSLLYALHKGRTPRWVRGLKFWNTLTARSVPPSHPTMGAWIEIQGGATIAQGLFVAPHDGCVD